MDLRTVIGGPPRAGLLVLVGALALGACAGPEPSSEEHWGPPVLVQSELGGMTGVHACGSVWIGGSASAEDLVLAARRGVALVVDLGPDEVREFDAASVCAAQGMQYVPEPIGPEGPSESSIDRLLEILATHEEGPVLLTSKTGCEAAIVLALYRATYWRLDLEAALAEGRRAGMKPEAEAFVAEQVARLQAG